MTDTAIRAAVLDADSPNGDTLLGENGDKPTLRTPPPVAPHLAARLASAEIARAIRQASDYLMKMPREKLAIVAAPLWNELGIRDAVRFSELPTGAEFGMMVRGHLFTHDGDKLILRPWYNSVLKALATQANPVRAPDMLAMCVIRAASASLLIKVSLGKFHEPACNHITD